MMKKNEKKLKVYLILADENLFHPRYLLGLLNSFKNKNYQIVGVTIAKDPFRNGFLHAVKQQIGLWGFLPFTFIAGNTVIRSILFKLNFPGNLTIQSVCKKFGIPLRVSENVNSSEHLNYLKNKNIDIIVSSNGQIFREELLKVPKIACINRHTGLLPLYGGVVPVFWAMLNQEKEFGVSIHYMVKAIDQGDIISQIRIPVDRKNSLFQNYILGFNKSVDATVLALSNIEEGKIVKKFSKNKNNYFSFPNAIDIKRFKKRYRSFNWSDVFSYYFGS